jgi:hypothetical protein
MDLAEIISKNKAKTEAIAIALTRIFNAVFWNKIKKYSRITIGLVLKLHSQQKFSGVVHRPAAPDFSELAS